MICINVARRVIRREFEGSYDDVWELKSNDMSSLANVSQGFFNWVKAKGSRFHGLTCDFAALRY